MDKKNESPVLSSWTIHMAKRNPARAISVMILILVCAYFIHLTMEDLFFTLIATAVLVIMVLPYYLPTTFTLSEEGVSKKMLFSNQKRAWSEFNRYSVDRNTIKLYTMKKESRLDNYRSFLLICNKNKDDVVKIVEEKIKKVES
jgi:hypothetical protein